MKIPTFFLLFTLFSILSCTNDQKTIHKNDQGNDLKPIDIEDYFDIKKPGYSDTISINDLVDFEIAIKDTSHQADSVKLYLNGRLIHSGSNATFSLPITPEKVGKSNLTLEVFLQGGLSQRKQFDLFLLSNVKPERIKYSLVKTYPHSSDNFTEGLVFQDGFLYEGTGNWGQSALIKSNLATGEILMRANLSTDRFGEGIAILNDKIIQLTYKSMEGYVYDKSSFSLIKKFTYSLATEGWGLTTDGSNLIMSNGTDKLIVLDSTYYTILNEIQVCDDKEPIDSLNELEYVDGVLYANIWMDNRIAQIDYNSGKVLGYIDLKEMIPAEYRDHQSDVLNGIALNSENETLLVTGKRWENIYEIRLD